MGWVEVEVDIELEWGIDEDNKKKEDELRMVDDLMREKEKNVKIEVYIIEKEIEERGDESDRWEGGKIKIERIEKIESDIMK